MRASRFAAMMAVLVFIGVVGAATSAAGSDGDPLILGQLNQAASTTTLTDSELTGLDPTLEVIGHGDGPDFGAFTARSSEGPAILGDGVTGVEGIGTVGLRGIGSTGLLATGDPGVLAERTEEGFGTALEARGRVEFPENSGIAVVPAGKRMVVVSPENIVFGTSIVLATLNDLRQGVYVQAAVVHDSSVTIVLNARVGVDTDVAWLVLN